MCLKCRTCSSSAFPTSSERAPLSLGHCADIQMIVHNKRMQRIRSDEIWYGEKVMLSTMHIDGMHEA
jgi:hypothetical protein